MPQMAICGVRAGLRSQLCGGGVVWLGCLWVTVLCLVRAAQSKGKQFCEQRGLRIVFPIPTAIFLVSEK